MREQRRLNVIECFGSPREIGIQIGAKCGDNIAKALQMIIGGLSLLHNAEKSNIIANALNGQMGTVLFCSLLGLRHPYEIGMLPKPERNVPILAHNQHNASLHLNNYIMVSLS